MESKSTARCVSSETHGNALLQNMKTFWSSDVILDYTLLADGEEIHVHRLMMAACSDYFKAMFFGNMKESKQSSVELQGIKATHLKSLINFAYTGDLHLSLENVEDIVSTAQYLQMAEAVALCSTFVQENLRWETVLDIQKLAKKYRLDCVSATIRPFMLRNIESISRKTFAKMDEDMLFDLLASNSLCIQSEYTLFKKLVTFRSVKSEDAFHEMLCQVRFPLMTKTQLSRVARSEVMSSSRNYDLLEEALDYKNDVTKQPLKQTTRTQVRSDVTSFLFTADGLTLYTSKATDVQILRHPAIQPPFDMDQFAVVDNFLYVSSLFDTDITLDRTDLYRYDPRFNKWTQMAAMSKGRSRFLLIPHQGKLYAIGGTTEGTVERYSIEENEWQLMDSVRNVSPDAAGIVHQNKIYVSGGRRRRGEVDNFSCYDPANDTWETKASMLKPRVYHKMAVVNDKIYALSGKGNSSMLTVEYYMQDVDQWTLTDVGLDRRIYGLFVNGTDVYICRRSEKESLTSELVDFEKYDIETNQSEKLFEKGIQHSHFGKRPLNLPVLSTCLVIPNSVLSRGMMIM